MHDISTNTYHHPEAAAGCVVQLVGTGFFLFQHGFTEEWLNIGEEDLQVRDTRRDLKTDICN